MARRCGYSGIAIGDETINPFDAAVVHFINHFARGSRLFDYLVGALPNNLLINGGIVTAMIWAMWVRHSPEQERDRSFLTAGLALTMVALAVSRVLALTLPFRERPRFTAALGFRMPLVKTDVSLLKWSSFPSDHAVMYFALATTLLLVSRRIGLFAYLHASIVVCFPLIYLGIHYPTDVICGALLGIGVAGLALDDRIRNGIDRPALRWRRSSPVTFYPFLYLWLLLTATEFDPVRNVAVTMWGMLKGRL